MDELKRMGMSNFVRFQEFENDYDDFEELMLKIHIFMTAHKQNMPKECLTIYSVLCRFHETIEEFKDIIGAFLTNGEYEKQRQDTQVVKNLYESWDGVFKDLEGAMDTADFFSKQYLFE